jgi:hypothetical protein
LNQRILENMSDPLDYEARARAFIVNVFSPNVDAALAVLTPEAAQAISRERLKQLQAQLILQFGDFNAVESVDIQQPPPRQVAVLTCAFARTKMGFRIVFEEDGHVAGFTVVPPATPWSPPLYADQQKFCERTLTLGSAPWNLPAVLTVPVGSGPFPAVVLVQGSGPSDEDETIGPNKVFKDLAWGLASNGVAVLRYPKRTYAHSAAIVAQNNLTVMDESVTDARLGIELLAKTAEVDPKRIFIVGHSLGGMLAPRIATGSAAAGLVILAGNSRPIEDLLVEQMEYLSARGMAPVTAVEAAKQTRTEIRNPTLKPDENVNFAGATTPGSYWIDLRAYNPTVTAAKLQIPMWIARGERDYQVTATELDGWKTALGSHANVAFNSYPALNHLFIAGTEPSLPTEYLTPGHVAEQVIQDIVAWIASL